MKLALLLVLAFASAGPAASVADLPRLYAPLGELILTQLISAPFPHPQRAEGHRYKDQFFSANEHYRDSTVAIFVPSGFRETGPVDFLVHFHGWGNDVQKALLKYQLIDQVAASHRNVVLVVPQGPRDASDSFGGKLEDPGGFERFMLEVEQTLRDKSRLKNKSFSLGQIILSGHSGGYHVMSAILDHGGLTDHIREVWLFDALYAETDKFLAWWDHQHGRFLDLYTEHGGTKEETLRLMAQLRQRGTPFRALDETEASPTDLTNREPIFLFSKLPHDEVLSAHQTFRFSLETSGLEPEAKP